MSSAQRELFVIARVFDITQFDNMLKKYLSYTYRGSTSLPTRTIEHSTHWAFIYSKSILETLEQGKKSVQR